MNKHPHQDRANSNWVVIPIVVAFLVVIVMGVGYLMFARQRAARAEYERMLQAEKAAMQAKVEAVNRMRQAEARAAEAAATEAEKSRQPANVLPSASPAPTVDPGLAPSPPAEQPPARTR